MSDYLRDILGADTPHSAQPLGLVADSGPDIPGGEGANKGFWRRQLKDRLMRFAKMYGNVLFDVEIENIGRVTGHGQIIDAVASNIALIRIKNHPILGDMDLPIPSTQFEVVEAVIPDADYERITGKDVTPDKEPDKELKDEITGDEAMTMIRNAGAKHAKSKGRFAMARTYDDVIQGLRAQYDEIYDDIKKEKPELLKGKDIIDISSEFGSYKFNVDIENKDDFWGFIEAQKVSTTTRWYPPHQIDSLTRELNRRFAEKFLGTKKDGLITFYRNVTQEKDELADATAGYVSLDRKMAWDYNPTPRPDDVMRGKYTIKAKPDEVIGVLGYSGAVDEFAVVIPPEITGLPGRAERVGDLEKQGVDNAPWIDTQSQSRLGGGGPFRFMNPMAQFDYYALDAHPFGDGTTWSSFLSSNNLEARSISSKYNEIYGEGAWEKDWTLGNPNAQKFASLFVKFTDKDGKEKWGLNGEELRSFSSGQDMLNNADSGDDFDKNIKVLSTMQELLGKPFFVSKGHNQDDPRLEQAVVEPTPEPVQVNNISAEPDKEEFKGSELLDSAIKNNEINYDALPESTLTANFDRKDIPKEQDEAISAYSGSEFLDINAYLRTDEVSILTTKDYLDRNISNLDALIDEKGDVLEETKVYRGTSSMVDSNTHRMLEALQEGDIIEDPAYSSTTKNSKIAFSNFGLYSKIYDPDPRKVDAKTKNGGNSSFWSITLPVGSKALAKPEGQYPHSHEKEVLLPRGSKYKINGIRKIAQIDENGNETGSFNYFIDATVQLEDTPKPAEQESSEPETSIPNYRFRNDKTGWEYSDDHVVGSNRDNAPTDEELDAIVAYTGKGYDEINSILRGQGRSGDSPFSEEEIDASIENLTNLIDRNPPLGTNALVYRGVNNYAGFRWDSLEVGDEIVDKGFISVSPNAPTAGGFGSVQLEIEVLEDTKAIDVSRTVEDTKVGVSEQELILQRGTKFKVVAKTEKGLRLQVIGVEDGEAAEPKPETSGERKTGLFNEYESERADQITAEDTPLTDLGFDPDEEITIYRGVPDDVDSINSGDWVTTLPQLAKDYAGANGKVVSTKVKASELYADPSSGEGAYTEEMVWRPKADSEALPQSEAKPTSIDTTGTRLSSEVKEELNSLISSFNLANSEARGQAYREIAAELGRPMSLPWDNDRTPEGRETYQYISSAEDFDKAVPENDEERELLRIKNLFEEKVANNKDLQEAKKTLYSNKIYKDVVDALSSETNDFDEDNIDFGLMDVGRNLSRPRPRLRDDEIEEFSIESPDYSDEELNNVTYDVTVDIDESVEITNKDLKEFSESAAVSIILPSRALEEVLNEGRMKTVHETRRSQAGNSSEEYRALRVAYESLAFGYGGDSPMEERPVYGLLRSEKLPMPEDALMIYGGGKPAQIILKPEAKSRTTISDRDSLNLFEPTTPLTDPKFEASHLTRMAAVYREATGENFFETENFAKYGSIEAQIHGGVRLEDIGKVLFYETPSEELRELLTSKGIIWEVSRDKPYSKPRSFGGGLF